MSEDKARIYAAAFLAPLSIFVVFPIGLVALGVVSGEPVSLVSLAGAMNGAAFLVMLAYAATLVLGLPAYFLLHRWHLDTIWSAIGIGYLAGLCVLLLFAIDSRALLFSSWLWLNPLSLLGPIVAFVFWWVAKPKPGSQADR
jgi:hypothetical protein